MLHTWINWPLGSNTMLRFPPLHLFVFTDAFILSRCDRFFVLTRWSWSRSTSVWFSLFFFFFSFTMHWHHCWPNVITRSKNKPELCSPGRTRFTQLRFAGEHALPYSATLSGAKWRYLVGRSACPARWHADVMWDMLTWLMSDRDDARKNCFTTHHYHVTPRDVS